MSAVLEEYHLDLQLFLILVLFSLILIFCLQKKNIFCFSVSFWFFILSLNFKVYCPLFLKWRFDFQNEINMDLTHVTASVVGGQQYPRPGHSNIYHGRTSREGVFRGSCLNNHQGSYIKVKLKRKNLLTGNYRTSRFSPKSH